MCAAADPEIQSSLVSVDVVGLRFDRRLGQLLVGLAPRGWAPFQGQLALPGVLLGRGERLGEAAVRALTAKLGSRADSIGGVGQIVTFDEPNRDPRGPTLSVAMWAVIDAVTQTEGHSAATKGTGPGSAAPAAPGGAGPGSAGPGSAGPGSAGPGSAGPGSAGPGTAAPDGVGPGRAEPDSTARAGSARATTTWAAFDDVPALAFDHNRILQDCRSLLARSLWRDQVFSRALTGRRFATADAVDITGSLTGRPPDRGNLNRTLKAIPGLIRTEERIAARATGRPAAVWEWAH